MKKFVFAAVLLLAAAYLLFPTSAPVPETYLRIHIRADGNDSAAQTVKYKVKDSVVEFLTPYLAECETFEEAATALKSLLGAIEKTADKVLTQNGFSYKSAASLKTEDFPARSYDGFTLPAGLYDALIINLGSGAGDNWWCVVYPPLCFINSVPNGTNQIKYRSKLLEIIENWKKRAQK